MSDAKMQDHAYFEALLKQMADGGREAMLYDLQREDLSGLNPRKFPATEALQDQKIQSMNPVELWWFKKLQHGTLLDGRGWSTEVVRDDIVLDYQAGTGQRNDGAQNVRNALAKLLPSGFPKKGARPAVEGGRKRTWILPTLAECRRHLERVYKMGDCWPEDE